MTADGNFPVGLVTVLGPSPLPPLAYHPLPEPRQVESTRRAGGRVVPSGRR